MGEQDYNPVINQLIGFYNDPKFTKNAYIGCYAIGITGLIVKGILIGKNRDNYVVIPTSIGDEDLSRKIIIYAVDVAQTKEELKTK